MVAEKAADLPHPCYKAAAVHSSELTKYRSKP